MQIAYIRSFSKWGPEDIYKKISLSWELIKIFIESKRGPRFIRVCVSN